MEAETREEWLARKKAKPFWGKPRFKRHGEIRINLKRGVRKRATGFYEIKGECPCADCDHELGWDCDPNGGMADQPEGCFCCWDVCS